MHPFTSCFLTSSLFSEDQAPQTLKISCLSTIQGHRSFKVPEAHAHTYTQKELSEL